MKRTCYQSLSDYTKNGIVHIVAPTPVETEPQLFKVIKPQKFGQAEYQAQLKMFGINTNATQEQRDCLPYVTEGKMKESCGGDAGSGQFSMGYNFRPGFNEIGTSKYYG